MVLNKKAGIRTTPQRSAWMKRVGQRDTPAERAVRRLLTKLGARYRINVRGLPGTPDIANQKRRKAIFVNGCFWHHHAGCPRGRLPTRNHAFWLRKFQDNIDRDREKIHRLTESGYDVLVVWECELRDAEGLLIGLRKFWFDENV